MYVCIFVCVWGGGGVYTYLHNCTDKLVHSPSRSFFLVWPPLARISRRVCRVEVVYPPVCALHGTMIHVLDHEHMQNRWKMQLTLNFIIIYFLMEFLVHLYVRKYRIMSDHNFYIHIYCERCHRQFVLSITLLTWSVCTKLMLSLTVALHRYSHTQRPQTVLEGASMKSDRWEVPTDLTYQKRGHAGQGETSNKEMKSLDLPD